MIHYHGGPITPLDVARTVWTGRHAFVSFERPEQIALAAEVCQSFAIDNGAFSHWRAGCGRIDEEAYADFVNEWCQHPGFDWCLIPDVIDGSEADNDDAVARWSLDPALSVPVWHLHESLPRLESLCRTFPRVALGSSGQWADVGTAAWRDRMHVAMQACCDTHGRPLAKLHGLRMLNPTIFSHFPLSSADSTNVAQNHQRERNRYHLTPTMGALVMVDRIERHASAPYYSGSAGVSENLHLIG